MSISRDAHVKALLIFESRQGSILDSSYELLSFAERLGAETAVFLVGDGANLPRYGGRVYLADVGGSFSFRLALARDAAEACDSN